MVFYKICTKIIHKVYVELRSGLVCMECREPHHNQHTVSLLTDRMVVSPKVNRIRGARRARFGDCKMAGQYSKEEKNPKTHFLIFMKF